MKTLTLYYSYGGNTEKVAKLINKTVGGDICRIETEKEYPSDYNDVVDIGKREVDRKETPKIKPLGASLESYDKVVIGTPVWWYTFAPAIRTFLRDNKAALSGKKVFYFATNAGWLGSTLKDLDKEFPAENGGLNVKFNGTSMKTSVADVENFAKSIK